MLKLKNKIEALIVAGLNRNQILSYFLRINSSLAKIRMYFSLLKFKSKNAKKQKLIISRLKEYYYHKNLNPVMLRVKV